MRTRFATAAVMIAVSWTIGCTAQARSPEPVPVDRVECARCRMLISTEIGGGQIVSSKDDTRFYDDIACLAADWAAHADNTRAFVRVDDRWTDALEASYARPAAARTAMGSGVAAFPTAARAQAADREGRALTFDDVVKMTGARP